MRLVKTVPVVLLFFTSCSYIPGASYSWNPSLKAVGGNVEVLLYRDLNLGKKVYGSASPAPRSHSATISNVHDLSPFIDHQTHYDNRNGFYSWADYVFEETDSAGASFGPWPHYSFVNIALLREKTRVITAKSPVYTGRPELMNPNSPAEIEFKVDKIGDLGDDEETGVFQVYQIEARMDMDNPFSGFLPAGRYLMALYLKKNYYIELAVFDDHEYPDRIEADTASGRSQAPPYLQSPAWKKIKDALVKLGVK